MSLHCNRYALDLDGRGGDPQLFDKGALVARQRLPVEHGSVVKQVLKMKMMPLCTGISDM